VHAVLPEVVDERPGDMVGDRRIVVRQRVGLEVVELRFPGAPAGCAPAPDDPSDGGEDLLPHSGVVGTHIDQQHGPVRDDVGLGARLDAADGDDPEVVRGDHAGDDRLQPHDDRARDDDGVDPQVGHGAVRTPSVHSDPQGVTGREDGPGGGADVAGCGTVVPSAPVVVTAEA
jgi:hypothetical protein